MNRKEEDQLFREFSLQVSTLEIGDALENARRYLQQFMPIQTIGLYYADEERRAIYSAAEVNEAGQVYAPAVPVLAVDAALQERIERDRRSEVAVSVYNNPETMDPFLLQRRPELAMRSAMVLRLRLQGEPIGVLMISATGYNRYTPEHRRVLEIVKEPMAVALRNARQYQQTLHLKNLLADDYRALSVEVERLSGSQVVGAEFGLRHAMEMVRRVAPLTSPVLLLGETGTGKEVIANAIHLASARREGPMIRVQCGALPESLLDSELFGHEKGAFTGAFEQKRGRFERANTGTIFLDEIAELTAGAQVKLLRVLQEKQFERLGGSQTLTVDVRVIAATHRDLQDRVRRGTFREDLWFRLNVFPIHLPPLRLRKEDIPSLVQHFVERKSREMNLRIPSKLADGAMEKLLNYGWPGNVRELQNVVERALILNQGRELDFPIFAPGGPRHAPAAAPAPDAPAAPAPAVRPLAEVAAEHIRRTLAQTRGRVGGPDGAAALLGVNPSTLRSRMRKLGIPFGRSARSAGEPRLRRPGPASLPG